MLQHVVYRRQVEVHLADVLGLEGANLDLDNDESAQTQVVEQQIEPVFLTADLERVLTADEREADTEFNEELPKVFEQRPFEVALSCFVREWSESRSCTDP